MLKVILRMQNFFMKTKDIIVQYHGYIMHYASYQAMWAAIGDPAEGKVWKHLAIIKPFVHGYWFSPSQKQNSVGLLEHLRLPLRQLYAHRIKADYELVEINQNIVETMIKTVDDLINTVLSKGRHGT